MSATEKMNTTTLLKGKEKADMVAYTEATRKISLLKKKIEAYNSRIRALEEVRNNTRYACKKFHRLYRKRAKKYREKYKEEKEHGKSR